MVRNTYNSSVGGKRPDGECLVGIGVVAGLRFRLVKLRTRVVSNGSADA